MKLFQRTLIYKTYMTLYSLYLYIKDYNLISDTLYSKEFKSVIKHYLNINIKKDWLGRLYGVINPNININGQFDINNVIIELDGSNSNNNEYVKTWTYRQLHMIGELFKIKKLYDYISLDFKHVGPANQDNYLVVFDITSRKAMAKNFKKFIKHLFVYCVIGILTAIAVNIYIY